MKQKAKRSGPKKLVIAATACAALFALAGVRQMAQVSQAASDRKNLKQQRAAMGMPDPEQVRAQMLDDVARNLGLSASQKDRMRAVMEDGPDPRAVFSDRSLTREQRFERMRELREARDARMRSILSPGQLTRFQQMQEQRRQEMRERTQSQSWNLRGSGSDATQPGGQSTRGIRP
jgi:Spy/CpxP family protein refolding chaperone